MQITQSDFFYTDYLFDAQNVRNAVKFTSKLDQNVTYTFPLVDSVCERNVESILGPVFIDIANKAIAQKAAYERAQRERLPDAKSSLGEQEEFSLS